MFYKVTTSTDLSIIQVSPAEIEDVIRVLDGVADVGVVGIPHPEFGQVPRAYIVRKRPSLTAEDVNRFLKEELSWYKHLKGGIQFIDTIPKSPSGKILRRELQSIYENELTSHPPGNKNMQE